MDKPGFAEIDFGELNLFELRESREPNQADIQAGVFVKSQAEA